jgi:hypothetical protein
MSGEYAKKEVPTGEKPEFSGRKHDNKTLSKKVKIFDDKHIEDKDESTCSIKSHNKRSNKKKKKMKNVVYYETDSSMPSTSDNESTSPKRLERKYNEIPLRYPRISKRAPLLFVSLGKPSYFDGEVFYVK